MNPIDQGKLFVATQRRFRDWSIKQVSGYVHGVVDGHNRDKPQGVYVRRLFEPKPDIYAMGYVTGFIDAQGSDARFDPGTAFKFVLKAAAYRWWEKEND